MTGSSCANGVCDKYPNVSWTYYSPMPNGIIWNAPEAIPEVCYGENDTNYVGNDCGSVNNGTEWNNHMRFYSTMKTAPIFTDISSCNLANVSWVVPDRAWSDHPFSNVTGAALGPSWVADIVNAIGNSYGNSGHACDYWGYPAHQGLAPQPTAIFIVWDDWGGFYDHVSPYEVLTGSRSGNSWSCPSPATNNWGCGYTYGFRVPLLVVSEFTGLMPQSGVYTNYISGQCSNGCTNNTFPFQHDFGSILAFTEHNFALSNIDQSGHNGYADYNAPDWSADHITHVPLSDFFALWTSNSSVGRPFIQVPSSYGPSFFESYYATHAATPTGPDTD